MSFLRHGQIYQPMSLPKEWRQSVFGSASTPIGSMSLQLAIPWQVALQHCLPPLHQPAPFSRQPAETVNRSQPEGGGIFVQQNEEFSASIDTFVAASSRKGD